MSSSNLNLLCIFGAQLTIVVELVVPLCPEAQCVICFHFLSLLFHHRAPTSQLERLLVWWLPQLATQK